MFMRVIDIDPELLERSANAARHAAEEGIRHVGYEIEGDVEKILSTLAPQGPYGFTVRQEMQEDGTLKMQVQSTYDEIREEYQITRDMCDVISHTPLVEIRAGWYLFQEVINTGCLRGSTQINTNETLVLLPVAAGGGITGEIFWYRVPPEVLGRGTTPADAPTDPRELRLRNLAHHERYIEALRGGDVDGMLAMMNDSVQLGVRDYVNDTGTLTTPGDKESYGAYWRAFFARYDVVSVEILERVVQEWYLFCELRLTLRRRDSGKTVAFHTAEIFVPAKDGLFITQIGHGTDEAECRSSGAAIN
jgi:SnoaL-like domain